MAEPIAELRGVSQSYGSLQVLEGVDLAVASGESIAIVGPSGSGKTTLLNLLGTLERPAAGQVRFDGRDLAQLGPRDLAALRNQDIGLVFQSHHLLPQCSALENVLVPTLAARQVDRAAAVERGRDLLARVGLGEREGHRPGQLSGGECQRVAVVRALIRGPRLLLADEPTGSLDAAAADSLADLLCRLNADESVALVTVTHSARLAARMGRVLALERGRLVPATAAAGGE